MPEADDQSNNSPSAHDFPQPPTTAAANPSTQQQHLHNNDSTNAAAAIDESLMLEKGAPIPPRKFYRQKRYWIVCSIITTIIVVVVVLLALFVFYPMIAQFLMNQSGIEVGDAQITFHPPKDNLHKRGGVDATSITPAADLNSTFFMSMASDLTNTGPFPAALHFHNPINVYYNDTLLGKMTLPDSNIALGKGHIDAVTPFEIANTTFFALFAKEMLAVDEFKWRLKGKLDITALTRTATVDLDKEITIAGMGGFPNVKIESFKLPGDDPNGGIFVELGTVLTSPSPVSVQLGTISMNIAYDGVGLGIVSAHDVVLKQGENHIYLKGTLVPQTDQGSLDKVGTLFSNYIAGRVSQTQASGVSAAPNGVDSVGWLSEGFQSVKLNVGLSAGAPLDIIQSVQLGYLDLAFSNDKPYAPIMSAPNVVAGFHIPFGFSLNITQVKQELELANRETNTSFARISTPWMPSVCDQQAGRLSFGMANDSLEALDGREHEFNDYTYALTAKDMYNFLIRGHATTQTQTPIGNITLEGIGLNVTTGLHGLQFLNSTPTIIHSIDVIGGQPDHLELAINTTMTNPSDFSIYTGNVAFDMKANDTKLGTVYLNGLKLNRGSNTMMAAAAFDPKSSSTGQQLLSTFVMGQDNSVGISGYDHSTSIASLADALGAISLTTTLPGLKTPLIQYAKLFVMNDTTQTSIVHVQVGIANPFTANITITSVKSAASYHGMPIGNIDQPMNPPFNVPGHATANSTDLDMRMNLEPSAVALLLRDLAVRSQMDTRPLDALLTMGGFHIKGQEQVSPDPALFQGFNISSYVMQAMQALAVDLQLESGLTIGAYDDLLRFAQNNVPILTDASVTRLIPVVGLPIVQQIVDGAKLEFSTVTLSEPTDTGFHLQLAGSLSNTGPMAANISFAQPLNVFWKQGTDAEILLGTVAMDAIQTQPNIGAQFNVSGQFAIADAQRMGEFAAYLINSEEFVWDIVSQGGVNVDAIGYVFTGINMTKSVTLKGAQGFKNCVAIHSFDLPANDPAGGIQLIAQTEIRNPSQVGFVLSGAAFESFFDNTLLGPLASAGDAVFPAQGTSNMKMNGRLIHQDSQQGLDAVTEVFSNYLAGKSSSLTVKGVSGSGANGPVGWLTTGFKSISIDNVTLPGPDKVPELIPSITLDDMQLDFTKEAYAPIAGSNHVRAQLKNPFGFPLTISSLNMDVDVSYQNQRTAHMHIPDVPSSTDPQGVINTAFANVPFKVDDGAHGIFNGFTKSLTESNSVTFGMTGSANSVAETAVGSLKLHNITYNVQTSLNGFNSFGGKTTIVKMVVSGGTKEYIEVSLTVSFDNPSNITINIGDLDFDVVMNENQVTIGQVHMKQVELKPGTNTLDAIMHLHNDDHKDVIDHVVSIYMTDSQVALRIQGTPASTVVESLKEALATVHMDTVMHGIQRQLIPKAEVQAQATVVLSKQAKAWITLHNPLGTPYTLYKAQVDVTNPNNGDPYKMGSVDFVLPEPLKVPPGQDVRTSEWPVDIDANALHLLGLLGDGELDLDLQPNVTVTVGENDGTGYYTSFYYYQDKVPASLDIQALGISLPNDEDAKNGTLLGGIL